MVVLLLQDMAANYKSNQIEFVLHLICTKRTSAMQGFPVPNQLDTVYLLDRIH